jgi:hypothetical protein
MQLMTAKLSASARFNRGHHFELAQVKVLALFGFVLRTMQAKYISHLQRRPSHRLLVILLWFQG